jgi:hypothetical protein
VTPRTVAAAQEYWDRYYGEEFIAGLGTEDILATLSRVPARGTWVDLGAGSESLLWSIPLRAEHLIAADIDPQRLALLHAYAEVTRPRGAYRTVLDLCGRTDDDFADRCRSLAATVTADCLSGEPLPFTPASIGLITQFGLLGLTTSPAQFTTCWHHTIADHLRPHHRGRRVRLRLDLPRDEDMTRTGPHPSDDLIFAPVGITHLTGDNSDLLKAGAAGRSHIRVTTAAQLNGIPHLGTVVTMLTVFAFTQHCSDILGLPATSPPVWKSSRPSWPPATASCGSGRGAPAAGSRRNPPKTCASPPCPARSSSTATAPTTAPTPRPSTSTAAAGMTPTPPSALSKRATCSPPNETPTTARLEAEAAGPGGGVLPELGLERASEAAGTNG